MRKFLLSLAAAVLSVASAMAAEASFTFTGSGTTPAFGLARQIVNNPTAIEDPFEISEQGVVLTFSAGGNGGWALAANKGMVTTSGMQLLPSGSNHKLTIAAPGAILSKVVLTLNKNVAITVDGTTESASSYTWEGASESVEFSFGTPQSMTYVKTLEITYAAGSADQKEPGLAFTESEVSTVFGEDFTAPELLNPNNLPVTWSSSKTTVATVDETGAVTLVGGGTTTITAFTSGNDEFAAGFASYQLKVTPVATSAAQLLTMAPNVNDVVKIDFPITVTYSSSKEGYIWGVDPENNAVALKYEFTEGTYKVGSVIPAGWFAVNNTSNGDVTWTGTIFAAGAPTEEVKYPEVNVITSADVAKVLWLKSVVFDEGTPGSGQIMNMTVKDQPIVVTNLFGTASEPAGAYDVLGVVAVRVYGGKESVYFYPIEYKAGEAPKPMVEKSTSIDLAAALGATSNSVTKLEIPYSVTVAPVELTLTEAAQAYYYSTKGLQLRPTSSSVEGTSKFTISTDGRQIKKVEIIGGWIDPVTVNGTTLPEGKWNGTIQNYVYTWEAPVTFDGDNVEVTATVDGNQFLTDINVYYLEEGSGLIVPNLSVVNKDVTVSLAEKTIDLASNLNNPNEAPIVWTIDDEELGSIEGSTLTFKTSGSVTVTASVDDPEYDPESVTYELYVLNAAFKADQLAILAPEEGDKVSVNSRLGFIVAASTTGSYYDAELEKNINEGYIFCESNDGTPVVLYKVSDTVSISGFDKNRMIPGNWTATNVSTPDMQIWQTTTSSDGSAYGWFEAFKEVENFEGVTEYKVVVLKNATLPGVPKEKGLIMGNLSDGSPLAVIALVNRTSALNRGIYDMTGIMVKNVNGEPVFYPASYTLVEELPEPLPTDFPTSVEVITDGDAVNVSQEYDEEEGQILITLTGSTQKDSLEVIFTAPEGWDGFYGANMEDIGVPGSLRVPTEEEAWIPAEFVTSMNLQKTDSLTFKVDEKGTPFAGALYLYKGDQVYTGHSIYLMGTVVYDDLTGADVIEVADAEATYFNLQGVEVKNPVPGVYVKVADGKVTKVVIK